MRQRRQVVRLRGRHAWHDHVWLHGPSPRSGTPCPHRGTAAGERQMRIVHVTVGLLALSVAGCTHMSVVERPADFLTAKRPGRVWMTGADNSEVMVTHPALRGDTLSG